VKKSLYGPKGVGALFVRRELQSSVEPVIYGGGQENNLRGGTVPSHLCVGMGAAAELYQGSLFQVERNLIKSLRDLFVSKVCALDKSFKLNGPNLENRHPGNANICFNGFVAQDILMALQPKLAASSGSACTSGTVEPSYILRAVGLSTEKAEASIRFSMGRFTTDRDVEEAVSLLQGVLDQL
jgi:cysteine desulfurase